MAHAELTQAAAGEAMSPRRRWLAASLEASLGRLVEIPAALLVVAEIVILFAGVVARYGLHQPLIWSDELASILFLWLAMLGAAVAFSRAEHMRMTAIVASAKPAMRSPGLPTNTPTRKVSSPRRRCRFPISGAPRRCRPAYA